MENSLSKPAKTIDASDVQPLNEPLKPVEKGNDDPGRNPNIIQQMSQQELHQPEHKIQQRDDKGTAELQLPNVVHNSPAKPGQPMHMEKGPASTNQMSSMPQPNVGEIGNQTTLLGRKRPDHAFLNINKPGEPVQKLRVPICWAPTVPIVKTNFSVAQNLVTSRGLPEPNETIYCELYTDPEDRKTLQRHLTWALHSRECQKTDTEYCSVVHCPMVKKILAHMLSCKVGMGCPELDCYYSRKIIYDWRACPEQGCPLCTTWRKLFQQIQSTTGHTEEQKGESPE